MRLSLVFGQIRLCENISWPEGFTSLRASKRKVWEREFLADKWNEICHFSIWLTSNFYFTLTAKVNGGKIYFSHWGHFFIQSGFERKRHFLFLAKWHWHPILLPMVLGSKSVEIMFFSWAGIIFIEMRFTYL